MKPARTVLAALAIATAAWAASATAATTRSSGTPAVPISAQVALDWNSNAVDAVRAARTFDGLPAGTVTPRALYQTEGLIYMAYTQAAVYDAVTKIAHRYRPYHRFEARAEDASLQAAVISAAYNTLNSYLGDPGGVLLAKYTASIAALPADASTARGIAVGAAAAADIVAFRSGDGRNAATAVFGAPFVYDSTNAGRWQVVAPFLAQGAQTPWVASMQPFLLKRSSQFRAPPPPALSSAQYATDFNETKTMGSLTSTVRTPAQTAIAWFWNGNVINQQNLLYRDLSVAHGMDLVDAVRLLAMGNLIASDAGIACFDSKYHYLHWRPISAIRNADLDGSPATAADPTWAPLLGTPNHPEYPSAHGCVTSAVSDTVANVLGSNQIDVTMWGATGGANTLTVTQHFDTPQQIQNQILDARVWAGLHWRNSNVAGEAVGNSVAAWALHRYFRPVDGNDDNDHQGDGNEGGDN